MNTTQGSKTCRGWLVLASLLLLPMVLHGMPTVKAGANPNRLRAETFSDPEDLAKVPKDWTARSVVHKDKAAYKKADLVLALGQQSYPVLGALIADYAQEKNLRIVIKQGTCGITAGKLLRKTVDIGAYCCPPGKTDRLPGLEFHSLGIAAIALIVHPDNPTTNVTTEEARRIFRGQTSRWPQVKPLSGQGVFNRFIQPVGRLHCKVRPGHWRLLLRNEDLFSPRLYEVGVIPDMISQVARNPRAIGYETALMVQHFPSKGKVRMLKINGHYPTDSAYLLAGKYPLYRTYHLTTWKGDGRANRLARELVRYLGQYIEKIHNEIGFIPPSQLQQAGWKFRGHELIGEPGKNNP